MTYSPRAWKSKSTQADRPLNDADAQMAALIKKERGIDVVPRIYRFRPSIGERKCGAWRWAMYLRGSNKQIGSSFTVSEILKAPRRAYSDVQWGAVEIDVERAKR